MNVLQTIFIFLIVMFVSFAVICISSAVITAMKLDSDTADEVFFKVAYVHSAIIGSSIIAFIFVLAWRFIYGI